MMRVCVWEGGGIDTSCTGAAQGQESALGQEGEPRQRARFLMAGVLTCDGYGVESAGHPLGKGGDKCFASVVRYLLPHSVMIFLVHATLTDLPNFSLISCRL